MEGNLGILKISFMPEHMEKTTRLCLCPASFIGIIKGLSIPLLVFQGLGVV